MTAQPIVHMGVDLAWGPKTRTGLAAVSADGRLLDSGSVGADDEIVEWFTDRRGGEAAGEEEPVDVVGVERTRD